MSELRASTISNLAGTGPVTLTKQSAAKSWINFDGSGSITVRDSINIASITDNGTGQYTLNFTNSFTDANYSASGLNGGNNGGSANYPQETYTPTASSIRGLYLLSNGNVHDPARAYFQAWGYLA